MSQERPAEHHEEQQDQRDRQPATSAAALGRRGPGRDRRRWGRPGRGRCRPGDRLGGGRGGHPLGGLRGDDDRHRPGRVVVTGVDRGGVLQQALAPGDRAEALGGGGHVPAPGGVLVHHRGDRRGQAPRVLHRARGLAGDVAQQGQRVGAGLVRRLPLHRGVQRGAEGPDVGLGVGVAAAGQLGGEVAGGAGEEPGLGQLVVAVAAGDAEVTDLGAAAAVQEHVAGLDVAVHDAALVGPGQRTGDPGPDVGHPQRGQAPLVGEDLGEGRPVDVLHDQPRAAVVVDDVVHRHDVGVVERGGRARLAHGARGLHLRLTRQAADLLDGDLAAEDLVPAQPDHAHATAPDGAQHEVAARDPLRFHGVLSVDTGAHPKWRARSAHPRGPRAFPGAGAPGNRCPGPGLRA